MKKLALLLALGLLAACGGGGSSDTPAPYKADGATGTLSISIKETAKTAPWIRNSDGTVGVAGNATKTFRRIIVTNPLIKNSDGKIVQFTLAAGDYDVNGTIPTLQILNLPVATGYTAQILEYEKPATAFGNYTQVSRVRATTGAFTYYSTPIAAYETAIKPYNIKKYDLKTFNMLATGGSVAFVMTSDIAVTLSQPILFHGGIPSGANLSYQNLSTLYTLKATLPAATPLASAWTLKQGYTVGAMTAATSVNGADTQNLVGPAAYDSSNGFWASYFSKGEFYLKADLLKGTELSTDFVYTSPNLLSSLYTKTGTFGP